MMLSRGGEKTRLGTDACSSCKMCLTCEMPSSGFPSSQDEFCVAILFRKCLHLAMAQVLGSKCHMWYHPLGTVSSDPESKHMCCASLSLFSGLIPHAYSNQ